MQSLQGSLLMYADGVACRFPQTYGLRRCFCTAEGEQSTNCTQMLVNDADHHAVYICILCIDLWTDALIQ